MWAARRAASSVALPKHQAAQQGIEFVQKPSSSKFYGANSQFEDQLDALKRELAERKTYLAARKILTSHDQIPARAFTSLGLTIDRKLTTINWLTQNNMTIAMNLTKALSLSQFRLLLQTLNGLKALTPHLRLADSLDQSSSTLENDLNVVLAPFRRKSEIQSSSGVNRQLDAYGRSHAVGRRKESSASVWLAIAALPTSSESTSTEHSSSSATPTLTSDGNQEPTIGQVLVNNKSISTYFSDPTRRKEILRPFALTETLGKYNVFAIVRGGGICGQSDAVKLAIAKALVIHEGPAARKLLRKENLLTRDPRMVERKKTGQPKARKKNTYVKR